MHENVTKTTGGNAKKHAKALAAAKRMAHALTEIVRRGSMSRKDFDLALAEHANAIAEAAQVNKAAQ